MKWYSDGCGGGERRDREIEIEGESCNYLEKEREKGCNWCNEQVSDSLSAIAHPPTDDVSISFIMRLIIKQFVSQESR